MKWNKRHQVAPDSCPLHHPNPRSSHWRFVNIEPSAVALAEPLDLRARQLFNGALGPCVGLDNRRRPMKTLCAPCLGDHPGNIRLPCGRRFVQTNTARGAIQFVGLRAEARPAGLANDGIQMPLPSRQVRILRVLPIPKTELPSQCQLPAVDAGLGAPKGLGTGGNKPLMRNRRAPDESATAIGLLSATLL